jgi:hypothetical protein
MLEGRCQYVADNVRDAVTDAFTEHRNDKGQFAHYVH